MAALGDMAGDDSAIPAQNAAAAPQLPAVRLGARPALMPELGWTLMAVLVVCAAGGVVLLVVWLSGGTLCIDDFQHYFLPGYVDTNRALREGSFPLLSLSSWYGGDLVGEYQYNVFSIAHLLIVLSVFQLGLSLSGVGTTLIAIYTAILSSGAFRLGRRLGLTVPNAMIMCLAATLNGWIFYWGVRTWIGSLTGCAWIPWAWWGLEVSLDRRLSAWRFVPGGILLYLLLAGGWPYAILMVGLVTVWLGCREWRLFLNGKIWPIFAAWTLGLALASPALLALVEYDQFTERINQNQLAPGDSLWRVSLAAYGGTIVPQTPAYWSSFDGPSLRSSCELFCGLVPSVALFAALVRWRMSFIAKYRWELGLLVLVAILCRYGTLGPFRWPFRWLPLFHLVLGLLGGFALQQWSTLWEPRMPRYEWMRWFARPGFRLGVVAAAMLLYGWLRPSFDPTLEFHAAGTYLLGLAVPWLLFDLWLPDSSRLRRWLPWMIAGIPLFLTILCYLQAESVVPRRYFYMLLGILVALVARQWSFAKRLPSLLDKKRIVAWFGFGSLGAWSCVLVAAMTVWAWTMSSSHLANDIILTGLALFALSLAWLFGDRRLSADSPARVWIPVAVAGLALIVGNYRPVHSVKVWGLSENIRQPGPFDKNRTYLALLTNEDVFGGTKDLGREIGRSGNTAMYSGVSFVNGYSAMCSGPYEKLLGLHWCGYTTLSQGESLLRSPAGRGLLRQMGVDGLVLGPDFTGYTKLAEESGWTSVAQLPLGTIFHRPGPPMPRVRSLTDVVEVKSDHQECVSESSLSTATIRDVAETRLSVRCQVENLDRQRDALIAFSRAYYPGYRADLNGKEIPVEGLNGLQPVVKLSPGGKGELALVFAPKSVRLGIMMAVTSLLATAVFLTTNVLCRGWPARH